MNNIKSPDYYNRQFKNDIPPKLTPQPTLTVATTALSILCLYKPLTRPISLCADSCRALSNLHDLSKDFKCIALLKTAASVIALACTILSLPLGLLITTCQDIFITGGEILKSFKEENRKEACEKIAQLMSSVLYLGLFFTGSLLLLVVSLSIQLLLTCYHSADELKKGHYIESGCHALMTCVKAYQLQPKIEQLQVQSITVTRPRTAQLKAVDDLPLPQQGKEPLIYHSDKDKKLRNAFLKSIDGAKKSILIMSFTFSDDEIIHLLLKKANQGVDVTLIVDEDQMGSILPFAQHFTLLTRSYGEGRIHHKVMVLDEIVVWIGSANFSPDSLTIQNNIMIGVYSLEMAKAFHEEKEVYLGLRERTSTPFPPLIIGGQKVEMLLFPYVPYDVENPPEKALNDYGKQRLIELMDSAKKNLRLAICVWTDQDLAQAAIRAHQRGVKVEVILWKEEESPAIAHLLRSSGINVTQKSHLPLMHNKWMLVDTTTFYNGSANWSKSWFSRNDESGIILNKLRYEQERYLMDYWKTLLRA